MQIKEKLSPAGATPEDISGLESRLGTPLADDYRKFLSQWNGGKPDKRQFTCADGDNGGSLRAFFTIDRSAKYYNLFKEYEIYEDRIPPKTLPIACDSFGNLVLLNLGTRGQHGAIYFWETPKGTQPIVFGTSVAVSCD